VICWQIRRQNHHPSLSPPADRRRAASARPRGKGGGHGREGAKGPVCLLNLGGGGLNTQTHVRTQHGREMESEPLHVGRKSRGFVVYNRFSALVSSARSLVLFFFGVQFVSCPEGPRIIPPSCWSSDPACAKNSDFRQEGKS